MILDLNYKFDAITANGEVGQFSLRDLISFSEKTILFFYPKDNTPGCTTENKDFTALHKQFKNEGVTLIGVSKDSIESHKKFIEDHGLTIDLISDPDLVLHKDLGAYGEKNNYGKIVEGVIRSTFMLDKNGHILMEWRNIRAKGHAERVLNEIQSL